MVSMTHQTNHRLLEVKLQVKYLLLILIMRNCCLKTGLNALPSRLITAVSESPK